MGILGGITGAIGGLVSGGPMGAIAGGLAGLSDADKMRAMQGLQLRDWTGQEQNALNAAYGTMQGNLQSMTPQQQQAYVQQQAQSYFAPQEMQINQGLQHGMAMNAARTARSGMAGSSMAQGEDRATATAGAAELAKAAAQSQLYGNQQYFNWDQNRRANVGSAQSTIGSLWGIRNGSSARYSETPSSPMGTGLGLLGMGLMSGSPYAKKANDWVGGLFGGGGGGGGASPAIAAPRTSYSNSLVPAGSDWMPSYNPPQQSRGPY